MHPSSRALIKQRTSGVICELLNHAVDDLAPCCPLGLQYSLNRLFPDRLIFLHVGRFLLHPRNYLWQRIARLYHAYLRPHVHRVGLQVRSQGWPSGVEPKDPTGAEKPGE